MACGGWSIKELGTCEQSSIFSMRPWSLSIRLQSLSIRQQGHLEDKRWYKKRNECKEKWVQNTEAEPATYKKATSTTREQVMHTKHNRVAMWFDYCQWEIAADVMGNINVSYPRPTNGLYLITLIVVSSPVHPPRQWQFCPPASLFMLLHSGSPCRPQHSPGMTWEGTVHRYWPTTQSLDVCKIAGN